MSELTEMHEPSAEPPTKPYEVRVYMSVAVSHGGATLQEFVARDVKTFTDDDTHTGLPIVVDAAVTDAYDEAMRSAKAMQANLAARH